LASALLKEVHRLRNLERAWHVIQENARGSKSQDVRSEIERFGQDAGSNLRSLAGRLSHGTFQFEPAKGVPIPKLNEHGRKTGKIRPIVLPPVEARIVQRALLNVLTSMPQLQCYIDTPYSFGGVRRKAEIGDEAQLAAVPAAIKSVLDEIARGARFAICADIKGFFTRVKKSAVSSIISSAVSDSEFVEFIEHAIHVELSNMAQLRGHLAEFPIEDIGVAQGNSLSPLLGNVILANFDSVLNDSDCRCIRYVDDFVILGPTERAVNSRLRTAVDLLSALGMELSPEKSSTGAFRIDRGLDFLGISLKPGFIRPSDKAQNKLLASIRSEFEESIGFFNAFRSNESVEKTRSLVATLKRVDGIVEGWGKHYWFCNDDQEFDRLDRKIDGLIRNFLGAYVDTRRRTTSAKHRALLGVSELSALERSPFAYPKSGGLGERVTAELVA
jgi:retron-type reverse transcriptase